MLHRCAINVFVLQCVRNPLAMCSKCVTNVLQMWPTVCALQFAMKVIWWRGSEATICRIGQSHITIVMRSGKQVETTFWTLKRKDLIHIIRELFDGDIWSWHLRGDTVEAPPFSTSGTLSSIFHRRLPPLWNCYNSHLCFLVRGDT